jgi:hypothetical protein
MLSDHLKQKLPCEPPPFRNNFLSDSIPIGILVDAEGRICSVDLYANCHPSTTRNRRSSVLERTPLNRYVKTTITTLGRSSTVPNRMSQSTETRVHLVDRSGNPSRIGFVLEESIHFRRKTLK